jgi:uncharacterized protein (DUF427 family)
LTAPHEEHLLAERDEDLMKEPNSDHPITVAPNPHRVRVLVGGVIVAETTHALTLKEAALPPVQYIPRADVATDLLDRSSRKTHCPYKGDASYWDVTAGGVRVRDAVWSYETPFPAVSGIAGHLAFYADKVDAIEELRE